MWTVNRMLGCIALVATACCAVPGAHAASLRAASGNVEDAVESTNGLNVPLGWSFDAQSPPTEGDYFTRARPLLALVAGKKSDGLGNILPQGAMVTRGQRYTETISAGVVSDNVAWAKSQSSGVGIDASFLGMFSAGVDYKNMASSSFAQSTNQQYVQIGGALELERITLPTEGLELTGEAVDALQALPPLGDSDSLAAYAAFFNLWDAHIITEYVIGGTAHMHSSFDSTITSKSSISSNTVGAYIQAKFAQWGAGVSGNHSWTQQQGQVLATATSNTAIRCIGGDGSICAEFSSNTTGAFEKWVASITADGLTSSAVMVATSTEPLWSDRFDPDFLPTPTLAADLKKAYAMYLSACPGVDADNGFICAGRGQCELTGTASGGNGTCDCFPTYGGPTCACPSTSASADCSGHGTCSTSSAPGTCSCQKGWAGKDCSQAAKICPTDNVFGTGVCGSDYGNGKCNGLTGKCMCTDGRTGPACNIPCGNQDMSANIGPNEESTWWAVVGDRQNPLGYAYLGEGSRIEYVDKQGDTHVIAATDSGCQPPGNSFQQNADDACQFVFNHLGGHWNPDIAQIPVRQDPSVPPGSQTKLGYQVCPVAGYVVDPEMSKAGSPPSHTNPEYDADMGLNYRCTAICVPNE